MTSDPADDALFFLGHAPGNEDQAIGYPRMPEDRPHMAYYGTTSSGKSYAIEYVLRQLIRRDRVGGFCFIDPHGQTFWRVASYMRQRGRTDRVLFWDINDPDFVVTYDPFHFPNLPPATIAGNLSTALLATLGRVANPSDTPQLKTLLEAGLIALMQAKLPFAMARQLFDPEDTVVKAALRRRLREPNLLLTLDALPQFFQRFQQLAPPQRRIENLFKDDRLRLTFTTPAAGVDFLKLMNEGWKILVNTAPETQDDEAALLFTRLLVKQCFLAARARDPDDKKLKPFFLVIDEASRYLTPDTARVLKETRKFGLYGLLAMQSIEDARLANEETYVAIRSNVNAELVMKLTDFDESMYFARRFFGHWFNLREKKDEGQTATVAIPHTVERTAYAWTTGSVGGRSSTRTTSDNPDGYGSFAEATQRTETESATETTSFGVEYEYEKLMTGIVYWTPEEQERQAARLFALRKQGEGKRFGIVKVNDAKPVPIEIPFLSRAKYGRSEMRQWLRSFKSTQPSTLAIPAAEKQYRELIEKHLADLRRDAPAKATKKNSGGTQGKFTW